MHKPDKSATRKLRLFRCTNTVEGWRSWIADAIKDALSRFRGLLCCQGAADLGVARLDYGVDEIATAVVGKKGALHRVDGDFLKVLQGQTKSILGSFEFLGHGGVAHQAVVGVQCYAKFLLIENFKGMLGKAAGGAGMNIADQANFQRNPFVENVLREVAQFHRLTVHDGNVIDQPRPVSDAMRSAVLNGLPNRFLTEPLAGMNGDVEILPLNIVKGFRLFISYSFERLLALHHGDGVRKAFQVFRQAALVCPLMEPLR